MRLRSPAAPPLRSWFRAVLLVALLLLHSASGSWGGDWAKSRASQSTGPAAHGRDHKRHSEHFRYTKDDLLIAIPGQTERLPLIEASRSWRQGVTTFVALEKPLKEDAAPKGFLATSKQHNERFGSYADPRSKNQWEKAGDLRASVAPFLAANEMGLDSFKWVLYGDDDTVFFIDGALKMLENLDHNMPYLLSDDVWFVEDDAQGKRINTHPNRRAPRCLPCGYHDEAGEQRELPYGTFKAPEGCPCTYETVCKAPGNEGYFGPNCEWLQVHPGMWYFIHGGAGAILSAGLMRLISWDKIDGYFMRGSFASGDSMLTVAIYEMAGILPTDPGYGYYRDHVQLFDPGWRGYQSKGPEDWNFAVFDKGNDPEGVLQRSKQAIQPLCGLAWTDRLESAVGHGDCDEECHDQLTHLVSVHIRSRYADAFRLNTNDSSIPYTGPDNQKAAVYMHHLLGRAYAKYMKSRR